MEVIQFADNTTLYMSHQNLNYIRFCFETGLANIQDWFNANKLTLNVSKSVLMHFNSKGNQQSIQIKIGSICLQVVTHTKFLGVYLDKKLIWNKHVKRLQLKLSTQYCLLSRSKHLLSTHAKKNRYTMLRYIAVFYMAYLCGVTWHKRLILEN